MCVLFLFASLPRCLDHQIDQLMIQVNLKPPARRLKHSEGSVSCWFGLWEVCRYPIMYCIPHKSTRKQWRFGDDFIIFSFLTWPVSGSTSVMYRSISQSLTHFCQIPKTHRNPTDPICRFVAQKKKKTNKQKQFWSLVARPRAVSSATKTRCLGDSVVRGRGFARSGQLVIKYIIFGINYHIYIYYVLLCKHWYIYI